MGWYESVMADNVIYIAVGIIPNDTGEAENSNEIFIAAGLVPDDKAAAGGLAIPGFFGATLSPVLPLFKGNNL